MRDSWEQNCQTKDGWQIALIGCSRSSETWAQWTDVMSATDCEVPTRMKTLTRWTMVLSQEDHPRTHSTVREISWKTSVPESSVDGIIRKNLQLKWLKMRRSQELTEAHCSARTKRCELLLKKFSQFAADYIFFTDEWCSLRLQRWRNYEDRLSCPPVKAKKMKRVFKSTV